MSTWRITGRWLGVLPLWMEIIISYLKSSSPWIKVHRKYFLLNGYIFMTQMTALSMLVRSWRISSDGPNSKSPILNQYLSRAELFRVQNSLIMKSFLFGIYYSLFTSKIGRGLIFGKSKISLNTKSPFK